MAARYICVEGTEGVGKTTQVKKLVEHLRNKGYSVLETKEPGSSHSPLTMELRKIMLDAQFDEQMTRPARELISQAIRSIHLEKVVKPAMKTHDFIVQDRGVLSGLAYGEACGNDELDLHQLVEYVLCSALDENDSFYDDVVYLRGDVAAGLDRARDSKNEFEAGDAIEARGDSFMEQVADNFDYHVNEYDNVSIVDVGSKDIDGVFAEMLNALRLE